MNLNNLWRIQNSIIAFKKYILKKYSLIYNTYKNIKAMCGRARKTRIYLQRNGKLKSYLRAKIIGL